MLVDVKTLAVTVHVVLAIAVAVSVVVTVFKDQNTGTVKRCSSPSAHEHATGLRAITRNTGAAKRCSSPSAPITGLRTGTLVLDCVTCWFLGQPSNIVLLAGFTCVACCFYLLNI